MVEDNTPTVTARRRKPTKHMRLRLETVKKLRALGARMKAAKEKAKSEQIVVTDPDKPGEPTARQNKTTSASAPSVTTRKAKVKKASLAKPPVPKAKFRKRQVHKSWLPTHLFHAKRAHMTPFSAPLWRFAIPLTPTQKGYRATHRASHERGAVALDTSYMATIGLEGEQRSLDGLLKGLGIGTRVDASVWGTKGERWRKGLRVLETFAFEREGPHDLIAPVTLVWCVASSVYDKATVSEDKRKRKLFLRVHPSAFYQLWEEVVRLSKVAKPSIRVEDLRFEIGSIEIIGPGSTEALLGALWPTKSTGESIESVKAGTESTWKGLAGVTHPSTLPSGALLAFDVQDPRLHHPPRTITLPKTQEEQDRLVKLLSEWPVDQTLNPRIFDRTSRLRSCKLASQKAINRRRGNSKPGEYPLPLATDSQIPVLLYTSASHIASRNQHQSSWTLLAPWKTIQPIWYSIIYYPLSTGQQPRFAGLREQQQLAFEGRRPWFPGDYPGTKAGWEWEVAERKHRSEEWKKMPKGKRVIWEKVDLGRGRKGEVGEGWSCDWSLLLDDQNEKANSAVAGATDDNEIDMTKSSKDEQCKSPEAPSKPANLSHISSAEAECLLKAGPSVSLPAGGVNGCLITVRIDILNRGVPQTCARIYRLPSSTTDSELRKAWLALLPGNQHQRGQNRSKSKHSFPKLPKDAPAHVVQQRLAQSLLQPPRAGEDKYPACPGVEDLAGFVTTGNFNLAEGQGTGTGSLLLGKVSEEARRGGEEARLCIVRNAGMDVGRLARWEIVG
jgi:ribonuclease P/MRP protein subunit POP1